MALRAEKRLSYKDVAVKRLINSDTNDGNDTKAEIDHLTSN
jgi:hypothetical protein